MEVILFFFFSRITGGGEKKAELQLKAVFNVKGTKHYGRHPEVKSARGRGLMKAVIWEPTFVCRIRQCSYFPHPNPIFRRVKAWL